MKNLYFKSKTIWPLWFHIYNYGARRRFQISTPVLDELQRRLVSEMRETGIAATSLEELFPGEDWLERFVAYVGQHRHEATTNEAKPYLENFWEVRPKVDLENPFLQFSVNQRVLDTVNSYMQMNTKLNYYHLARTTPVGNAEATHSQRWHRDPEEPRMCKMFVYINGVDETAGPFIYVPHTVRGQRWGHVFPQRPPFGNYPPEERVQELLTHAAEARMTGPAGTVLFCDTTGLHRGGHATHKERIMFTAFYTSPRWSDPQRYVHTESSRRCLEGLSSQAQYALETK